MFKKIMIVMALLLAALLTGCATTTPIKYEVTNIEQSDQFAIQDLRPKTEGTKEMFSIWITSEAYGIYRIGEVGSEVDSMRLLQHRVYEKLASGSDDLDVKVHHLVVYMNLRASLKKSAMGAALAGALGVLIVDSLDKENPLPSGVSYVDSDVFDSMVEEEHQRGFYTEQENPEKTDVLIVYLDAEINGKRTFLRRISQITQEQDKNIFYEAVDNTVKALLMNY